MSYILDALRRAEAERERERGQLPGLHSQPLGASGAAPRSSARTVLGVGAAVSALALVAAGGWWWIDPRPTAPVGVATPVPGPVASPAPSESPRPAPAREPVARSAPAATAAAASRPSAAAPRQAAPAAAGASAAAAPLASNAHLPALAELPAELRGQLPRLVLTGLVHSPNPAQRMLILDGQLVREGDQPAPGLLLEEIRPQAAVFSFRGQRFSLTQ
jgi:general secretion pathway protein B